MLLNQNKSFQFFLVCLFVVGEAGLLLSDVFIQKGCTAVMKAVMKNNPEMVELLLEAGANINIKNNVNVNACYCLLLFLLCLLFLLDY